MLAEKLFNLSITSYPELVEIENEIKGFAQIFQLYSDFQVNLPHPLSMMSSLFYSAVSSASLVLVSHFNRMHNLNGQTRYGQNWMWHC